MACFTVFEVKYSSYEAEVVLVKDRIANAQTVLTHLNNDVNNGRITKDKAYKEFLTYVNLLNMRNDSNYFSVVDYDGNVLLSMLDDAKSPDFIYLYQDALKQGDAVRKYKWYKSGDSSKTLYDRISYAKTFEPWKIIVVTGSYSHVPSWLIANVIKIKLVIYLFLFVLVFAIFAIMKKRSLVRLLEAIPSPAWYSDRTGKLVYANRSFLRFNNLHASEVIGKYQLPNDKPEDVDRFAQEDAEVYRTGTMFYKEEDLRVNDRHCYVQIFKVPTYDVSGKIVGILGLQRDITKEKEVENVKQDFISLISHELRTPLTSIIGSLELILHLYKDQISDKVRGLLNITDRNSVKLKALIDTILNVSKLEAGKLEFEIKEYDIIPLLSDASQELESYAEKYSVELHNNNKIDSYKVNLDRERFKQVMSNLVSNAVKFSKKSAIVDIKTENLGNRIKISVTNYDAPISPSNLENIFKKFSQLNVEDARVKNGTGLGLYITQKLVEEMNGSIFVKSDEKETVFSITFAKAENI